jgi:TonB family protein
MIAECGSQAGRANGVSLGSFSARCPMLHFMRTALMSVLALFLASCASPPARPVTFTGEYLDAIANPAIVYLRPIMMPRPQIPLSVRQAGGGASAVVAFMVETDGSTSQVQLVSASNEKFGQAACQAVALWRFAPPTKGGKPVRAAKQVPIDFTQG